MPNIPTTTTYKWIRKSIRPNRVYSDSEHAKLYNSKRWRSLRLQYIKYNTLCVQCKDRDRIVAAKVIDHIIPVSEGGSFYEWNNLQSLCTRCHAIKTGKEVNKRKRDGKGI